ncbi:response regulator [Magnetospirillum sulfuroxidans]|uniref:Response regulator transcription factor n=1 Tax=Magnetospirillum sulfuroxidans TaxID=611300 RepID=A0ABS5ICD4_9PROT|nr:response regulator transcription factor [Magnetospirillum sulfuroxidans]MBR9972081.1 response regulator transcription factor [Magnetospirillum sulfuroxidans]
MRIILADDHVMLREGLRPFVERIAPGTIIQEAGSFTEALAQIEADPAVDLLILDIKMPGMNGFQGLSTVRTRFPAIRCVILSAVADRDHVLEAMRLGADGFIPKHLSGGAMVSALQLVLSGERFIPSMLMDNPGQPPGANDRSPSGDLLGRLTPRERDILHLLREGLPNKVIAARLDVSEVTVKSHLGNMFRKLGVQNRLQAMRMLVDTESL